MKRNKRFLTALIVVLTFSNFSFSQEQKKGIFRNLSVKPGIAFEYFNRTISWDNDKYTSDLKSLIFIFNADFEIKQGFLIGALFGYSKSNLDSLVFRNLPFSVELQAGGIGGFLFGGEIKNNFISFQNFEIEVLGQFVYSIGSKGEWDIPGLNVTGTATGKPSWTRVLIGPVVKYLGYEKFHPYLFVSYNKLGGTFTMEQSIQDLKGIEDKKISAKSNLGISVGTIYVMSSALSIKAEVGIMPYSGGMDFGLMLKTLFNL